MTTLSDLTTADRLTATAVAFITYYSRGGGCSNCGGLPHTKECFVGLFIAALAAGDAV